MPHLNSRPQPVLGLLRHHRATTILAAAMFCFMPVAGRSGDILRGGAPANTARPRASFGTTAADSDRARINARDALARTAQAMNAVQNAQAAARAIAAGASNLGTPGQPLPNVPDGLATGGLHFISATGAAAPVQSGNTVKVKQTTQEALLRWRTFNIGRNTTLDFDQSAGGADVGKWIAFNKVEDPSGLPSQILGSITAAGQVYVINQNGIIFGGSSQVNTHTLVASSLPLNENLITRGLLNNPDAQFLFSALAIPAGSKGPTPAFTPPALPASGKIGDVVVRAGAQLTAPTSEASVGGRIVLAGANVINAGTISTPDGQTILAAGLQVGFDAHRSTDPSLRGLDAFVGAVLDPASLLPEYAGTVTNTGLIDAPRASVIMTGKTVNQLAAINSTTSVSVNGRIDLSASYDALSNTAYDAVQRPNVAPFLHRSTGLVEFGPGSVTRILPEYDSTETRIGTALALRSQVNVTGRVVHMAPGSSILAPNAVVDVRAGVWDFVISGSSSASNTFVHSGGQIFLDQNSMINVAGSTDVAAPLSQYILAVELRGAEVKDSPLQRTSIFRPGDGNNPTITVDLRKTGVYNGRTWYGTPLADLSGYLNIIERSVGLLTVGGGSVSLNAGGSVVLQPGSVVDVSGGFVNYGGGTVTTTRVWYAGHLIEIASATPNRLYQGIFTGLFTESHPRWGISRTFRIPWMSGEHYEQPYVHGADGGSLAIGAAGMALDGDFWGHTVAGPRQRDDLPEGSDLTLTFQSQLVQREAPAYPYVSPTPPSIVFQEDSSLPPVPSFSLDGSGNPLPLPPERLARVFLRPSLYTTSGFASLTVKNPDGEVLVPKSVTLAGPPQGKLDITGSNITVEGSIVFPGGTVSLLSYNISPEVTANLLANVGLFPTPPPNEDRGGVTLGSGARISAAGLVVDDRLSAPDPLSLPIVTHGGDVSINAFTVNLAAGSVVDVSGGVVVSTAGSRSYGDGGSIVIKAGQDPGLASVIARTDAAGGPDSGGTLTLAGILRGYSGATGGALTLQAPLIQIGGSALHEKSLLLQSEFFRKGGFTSYTLTGVGGLNDEDGNILPSVYVAPETKIEPVAENYLAVLYGFETDAPSLITLLKPEGLRSPVSISLNAPALKDTLDSTILLSQGDLVLGRGALIRTDPLATVSLTGGTVAVFGSVIAPGGAITVKGADSYPTSDPLPTNAFTTVYLAPGSLLSTKGVTILLPDRFGRRTGYVLPGGDISVSGNIVAAAGAVLDASGTSDVLDVHPSYLNLNALGVGPLSLPMVPPSSGLTAALYASLSLPVDHDSDGGNISFKGGQLLFLDATLRGHAGGPTAVGGSLSVSSGKFNQIGTPRTSADINLEVRQSGLTIPVPFGSDETAIGQAVLFSGGSAVPAMGYFAASTFTQGGFDSLTLGGNVKFTGPVSLDARGYLKIASGGIIQADSIVNLTAPYVRLGMPFQVPLQSSQESILFTKTDAAGATSEYLFAPTYGTGVLNVNAGLLDIGTLSLQGIGRADLRSSGDIRGNGALEIAGDLYLQAGQIYPTTASRFTITAYDYTNGAGAQKGSVTISSMGAQGTPLSAGGVLSIYASNITQGGVLRAPIGGINLGWDGTGTAPTAPISGQPVPVAEKLSLLSGSITSVSAVDGLTGAELLIPFGFSADGNSWIDPAGIDITAGGVTSKAINLAAQNLVMETGSLLDVSGGGDLFAYRFIEGNGGSTDILASSTAFAVLPKYQSNFAPFAPFNDSADSDNLAAGEPGYVNDSLSVGDRVFLNASPGLKAGVYTLLPARYALMPGAFLVTPQSGSPTGTFTNPDGASYVAGYQFNDLNSGRRLSPLFSRFEVAPAATFLQRATYETFSANTFLRASAEAVGATVPRLPLDGGYLLFQSTTAMQIDGDVLASGAFGGRGGLVDISAPLDFIINESGTGGGLGVVALSSSKLSSFGAESLLIGGRRTFGDTFTAVTVRAGNITVDNAGTALSAPEIILAANRGITLAPGSVIEQSGTIVSADTLVVTGALELTTVGQSLTFQRGGTPINFPSGTPGTDRITSTVGGVITAANGATSTLTAGVSTTVASGSSVTLNSGGTITFASGTGGAIPITIGDGALVRVSGDPAAQTSRTAVASSTQPNLVVGAGAILRGASLTLDSTYASTLASTAVLEAGAINLNSGQISMQFTNPGALQPTVGLVLAGGALGYLAAADSLSLLSYSSIDLYGTGSFDAQGSLALHTSTIRGFNQLGSMLQFNASSITIDNSANVPVLAAASPPDGTLQFNAGTFQLGANPVRIDQFNTVEINASSGVLASGAGGLTVPQALTIRAPLLTTARSATQSLIAEGGPVNILSITGGSASVAGGLGGSLTIRGTAVTVNSDVLLPSGLLNVRATSGALTVGGNLDVGGTQQTFFDVVKYTDAGEITLTADAGSVSILAGARVNVSAATGGGDAGRVNINSPTSLLSVAGQLLGVADAGTSGILSLDVGRLPGTVPNQGLISSLTSSIVGFEQSRSIRDRLDTLVTVDGTSKAHIFNLSVDAGSILVTGTIDATGDTGGTIDLKAFGSVTLNAGSVLTVKGQNFSNAGKGGAVFLEAGSQRNGVIDPTGFVNLLGAAGLLPASSIDLSVTTPGNVALGQLSGTLHLRAPQNGTLFTNSTDIRVSALDSTITGGSSITVEGYWLFDISNAAGATITTTVQNNVRTNGNQLIGVAGTPAAGYNTMFNRILGGNAGLSSSLVIVPGAEIINRLGDLTLGTTTSNSTSDWNLGNTTAGQRFRFGDRFVPGVLTLRASGNLNLFNTISDGFTTSIYTSGLLANNTLVPLNAQSWSYRFAAGFDPTAVDFHRVRSLTTAELAALPENRPGSLRLGKNGGANTATGAANALTSAAIGLPTATTYKYQAIRTGTGDIDIATAGDVQLLNQFATIFTAGVQVTDPNMGGTFDTPVPNMNGTFTGTLGAVQQNPPSAVQYTLAGGNVTLNAGADVAHYTRNVTTATGGSLIADSSREMPVNWLYRRGAVDSTTGLFAPSKYQFIGDVPSDIASTTWWVDFTNFFEGVGALGGGDVTVVAGRDVSNVDAVVPTNARMPGKTVGGAAIAPNAASLVELGGGDLVVQAGRNIDGGVYYVERGSGTLFAGGAITTNRTRSPSRGIIFSLTNPEIFAPETWLPTTLFVGKSNFSVGARGDVLLGPVANPFLLPQGYNNSYWYKTYFSTYSPSSAVEITSLGGDIDLRKAVTLPSTARSASSPVLFEWFRRELLLVTSGEVSASNSQPWLRLSETNVTPFRTVMDLMAPTLKATAFSGDINTVGNFQLFPSPTGTLELSAAGAIGGLQPTGTVTISGVSTRLWSASTFNLSDTDPAAIYSISQPFGYQNLFATPSAGGMRTTQNTFLNTFNDRFVETGATTGAAAVVQFKQTRHAPGVLHTGDSNPVRLYALGGDVSTLTLYSGKRAQVFAGNDIADIALYIQNTSEADISIVAAGRDIIVYNPSTPARIQSTSTGNLLNALQPAALAGDIQISGPGTLEVLAGRDLSLGAAASVGDGTGAGITSIGNARNPYLPFEGASLIVGAGMGKSFGLANSTLDFDTFIDQILSGPDGARYFTEYATTATGIGSTVTSVAELELLPLEQRNAIALELFYLALRDAGRDSATAGGYAAGFAAIEALFPESSQGDITTFSRDIRTKNGGSINILTPGGGLSLGASIVGNPDPPPGIVTEYGGGINIFTNDSVDVGVSRIFTLRGGNLVIWSSAGDIAAGASAKTVASAPPTRVLIDPQSADIATDLAGLSTGGGIGVLATVKNVPPGDVDLIAPVGVVDAGDAGIRATGNLTIAATAVLNASNIAVGGSSVGTPTAPVVSAPNIGGLTAAGNAAGASTSAAADAMKQSTPATAQTPVETPSIITVEVLGYGGSDDDDEEERRRRKKL